MKTDMYTEELDNKLGDMGFIINPKLEKEGGNLTENELIEEYKTVYRAMKLLLILGNIEEKKLEQAMDLAEGMK